MNLSLIYRNKKAVSPVIAVVLLIALTIAAVAIIWGVTNNFLLLGQQGEIIIQNTGVADKSGNNLGDFMNIKVNNIGSEAVDIDSIEVTVNDQSYDSWVLAQSGGYTVPVGQMIISASTLTNSEMLTDQNDVFIQLFSGDTAVSDKRPVSVPAVLSSEAILYESGTDISTEDLEAQGWTQHDLASHSGGSGEGFEVTQDDPNKITVSTNHDLLYVLENDSYDLQNFLISSSITNGDDDALGYVFRYQDVNNYYYVGVTSDHFSTSNRAGHDESTDNIPWMGNNQNSLVFGKMENGNPTILGASDPQTNNPDLRGQANTKTWTEDFKLSVNGDTFSIEVSGKEMITITDSTFSNSGYVGLMAIAAQSSTFGDIIIQR